MNWILPSSQQTDLRQSTIALFISGCSWANADAFPAQVIRLQPLMRQFLMICVRFLPIAQPLEQHRNISMGHMLSAQKTLCEGEQHLRQVRSLTLVVCITLCKSCVDMVSWFHNDGGRDNFDARPLHHLQLASCRCWRRGVSKSSGIPSLWNHEATFVIALLQKFCWPKACRFPWRTHISELSFEQMAPVPCLWKNV